MTSVGKYGDLFKQATDLLTKAYKYDRTVEVKTRTRDGVNFKSTGKLNDKGFSADVETGVKFGNLELEKLNISTAGKLVGELKLAGVTDGLDLTFKAEEGTQDAAVISKAEFGAKYALAGNAGVLTAAVDVINGPVAKADALFQYDNVLLGGSVRVNSNLAGSGDEDNKDAGFALEDYSVGVGYQTADFRVALQAAKKFSVYNGAYHHKVNSKACVAAVVSVKDKAVDASVGGYYRCHADTEVQGLVNSAGVVSGVLTQHLNEAVTLSTAASVDSTDLASNKHKLGFKVSFKN